MKFNTKVESRVIGVFFSAFNASKFNGLDIKVEDIADGYEPVGVRTLQAVCGLERTFKDHMGGYYLFYLFDGFFFIGHIIVSFLGKRPEGLMCKAFGLFVEG